MFNDSAVANRVLNWCAMVTTALLIAFTFWPVFVGKFMVYGDLGALHLPSRYFIRDQMRHGRMPFWDPNSFGGLYLLGEGQNAILHPFHLLTYPLLNPEVLLQFEISAYYVVLLSGCYMLFRRWNISPIASLLGALAFAFAGFTRPHLPHVNLMAVVAHIPWMLVCVDAIFKPARPSFTPLAGLVALNTSAILYAYPPMYFFSILFQIWYSLSFVRNRRWWKRMLGVATCITLGLLLGMPQILPTIASIAGSVRSGADETFLTGGSWHLVYLLGYANPFLFEAGYLGGNYVDELRVAPGLCIMLLAGFGLLGIRRSTHPNNPRLLLGILLAFGLFFALGRFNPAYRLLVHIPIVREFRVPVRYFCFVQFALAGLCAFAIDDLRAARISRRPVAAVVLSLAALALATAVLIPSKLAAPPGAEVLLLRLFDAADIASVPWIVAGIVCALLTCGMFLLAATRGGMWADVALACTLIELCLSTGAFWLRYPAGTLRDVLSSISDPLVQPPARIAAPAEIRFHENPKEGPLRLYHRFWLTNLYNLAGYSTTTGYTGLAPRSVLPYWSEEYSILMGAESRWTETGGWQRIPEPLPQVRLLSHAVISKQPAKDISRIDYRTQAIVPHPVPINPNASGTVEIAHRSTASVRLKTSTSGTMLCVLAQRFNSGWKVELDGQRLESFPVYGDLTGFVVPAGTHIEELHFDPPGLRLGLQLAVGATLLLGFLSWKRRSISIWFGGTQVIELEPERLIARAAAAG